MGDELVVADLLLGLDLLLVAVLLRLLHALLLGHVGARQAGLLGDVGIQGQLSQHLKAS